MKNLIHKPFAVILLVFGMTFAFTSCGTLNKKTADESFESFYEEFHRDYAFQKSRIAFPIHGYREDQKGKVDWNATNWQLHKGKVTDITDNTFKVTIQKDKKKVYEQVIVPNSSFYFDRTFQLKKHQWYLVQCVDKGME